MRETKAQATSSMLQKLFMHHASKATGMRSQGKRQKQRRPKAIPLPTFARWVESNEREKAMGDVKHKPQSAPLGAGPSEEPSCT
jgi:hypothetical protein